MGLEVISISQVLHFKSYFRKVEALQAKDVIEIAESFLLLADPKNPAPLSDQEKVVLVDVIAKAVRDRTITSIEDDLIKSGYSDGVCKLLGKRITSLKKGIGDAHFLKDQSFSLWEVDTLRKCEDDAGEKVVYWRNINIHVLRALVGIQIAQKLAGIELNWRAISEKILEPSRAKNRANRMLNAVKVIVPNSTPFIQLVSDQSLDSQIDFLVRLCPEMPDEIVDFIRS